MYFKFNFPYKKHFKFELFVFVCDFDASKIGLTVTACGMGTKEIVEMLSKLPLL